MKDNTASAVNDAIKVVSGKKIYFGHQSVGFNILGGIKSIKGSDSLSIIETKNKADFSKAVFAHSPNGKNANPSSKIEAFAETIKNGLGDTADIACFKFCYIDVNAGTDVEKLFNEYRTTMNALSGKYKKTVFIHFTVPLTSEEYVTTKSAVKNMIKKLTGKKTYVEKSIADNLKRKQFNDLLRNEYASSVFDLAQLESSTVNGEKLTSKAGGTEHQVLNPKFTSDGGHLNQSGAQYIARHFLLYLSQIK